MLKNWRTWTFIFFLIFAGKALADSKLLISNLNSDDSIFVSDISSDEKYLLLVSNSPVLTGQENSTVRQIVLYDVQQGTSELITKNSEDVAGESDSFSAYFSDDERSIFVLTRAGNLVAEDQSNFSKIVKYNRNQSTFSLLPRPALLAPYRGIDRIYSGGSSHSLFMTAGDNNIYIWQDEVENWHTFSAPADMRGYLYLASIANNGSFLAKAGHSALLHVSADLEVSKVNTGGSFLWARLSGDGQTIAVGSRHNWSSIAVDDLSNPSTRVDINDSLLFNLLSGNSNIDSRFKAIWSLGNIALNQDGTLLYFRGKTGLSSLNDNLATTMDDNIWAYRLADKQIINLSLSLKDAAGQEFVHSLSQYSGNTLFLIKTETDIGNSLYRTTIDDSMFDIPAGNTEFSVSSTAPLTVHMSIESDFAQHFLLRQDTLTHSQYFYMGSELATAYKFDARQQDFTLYSCSEYLVCNSEQVQRTQVQIQDFATKPELQLTFAEVNEPGKQRLQYTASVEFPDQVDLAELKDLGAVTFHTLIDREGASVSTENSILAFARYCDSDAAACGGWSTASLHKAPQFIVESDLELLLTPDYQSLVINWPAEVGVEYTLYKAIQGGYKAVYQGSNTQFVETEFVFGQQSEYWLKYCIDDKCLSTNTLSFTPERVRVPLNYSVNNDNGNLNINIDNKFYYQNYKIYRREWQENSETLLTELPASEKSYIDSNVVSGAFYHYRVEGCYGEVCTTTYNPHSHPAPDITIRDLPAMPQNFNADASGLFGAVKLSWEPQTDIESYTLEITYSARGYTRWGRNGKEIVTLSGSTSEYIHIFNTQWGRKFSYQLIASKTQGNHIQYDSLPTTTSYDSFAANLADDLPEPLFLPTYDELQRRVTMELETWHKVSNLRIYKKLQDEDTFSLFSIANYNFGFNFIDIPPPAYNGNIDYKITWCSELLDKCYESQEYSVAVNHPREVEWKFYTDAPQLRLNSFGEVVVTPAIPKDSRVSNANVEYRKNGSGNYISGRIGDVFGDFLHPAADIQAGDIWEYRTSYCVHWSSQIDGEHCSPKSELAEITIPEQQFITSTVPDYSISLTSSQDGNSVVFRYGGDAQTHFGNSIAAASTVKVFVSENQEPFTLVQEVNGSEIVNSQNFYEFALQQDTYEFRTQLQLCNDAGCAPKTAVRNLYLSPVQEEPDLTPPSVALQKVQISNEAIDIMVRSADYFDEMEFAYLSDQGDPEQSNWIDNLAHNQYLRYDGFHSIPVRELVGQQKLVARICIAQQCGGWSEPLVFEIPVPASQDSNFPLYNLNLQQKPRFSPAWRFSGQQDTAYGELDTFAGRLSFTNWVKTSAGGQLNTRVRLSSDADHGCQVLWQQSLYLNERTEPRSFVSQSDEFAQRNLVSIVYTGNGCSDNEELELFEIYVLSDYLNHPVLLTDKASLLDSWLTFSIQLSEDGKLTIYPGNSQQIEGDLTLDDGIFDIAHLYWATGGDSRFSQTGFNWIDIATAQELKLQTTYWVSAIHPQFFDSRPVQFFPDSLTHIYQFRDDLYQQVVTTDYADGAFASEGLTPGEQNQLLFKVCQNQICGPTSLETLNAPNYARLSDWWYRPNALWHIQDTANALKFEIEMFWRHGDTFKMYQKTTGQEDFTFVEEKSFAQLLSESEFGLGGREFYWTIGNLHAEAQYIFKMEVCNPFGCVFSDETFALDVPVDSDGDGVLDRFDAFPNDPTESEDYDGDGIGNNADLDDDNDGIPDEAEAEFGFNPLDWRDVISDADRDGITNLYEYLLGTDPLNELNTPLTTMRMVSFEEGEPADYQIQGEFAIRSLSGIVFGRQAGNFTLTRSQPEKSHFQTQFESTGGKLLFALQDTFNRPVTVFVNGEPVSHTLVNGEFWLNRVSWAVHEAFIPAGPVDLRLEINHEYLTDPYQLIIDAIVLPAVKTSTERAVADFDGDGQSDLVIRNKPAFINYVKSLKTQNIDRITFGRNVSDIPVEGDFDGDKVTDIAVRRPSNYTWYIKRSSDGEIDRIRFGIQTTDIPVPADYDGDGITDVAVRRPSNQMWYIRNSSGIDPIDGNPDGISRVRFGLRKEDIPVAADYDGDGKADIAVRRPSNQMWYILQSRDGEIRREHFGKQAGDIPVPADYDGDGKADVAVRRSNNFHWYILQSSDAMIRRVVFGRDSSDIPVVADYDGDGYADIAVRRHSNHHWYILRSSDSQISREIFGRDPEYLPLLSPIGDRMSATSNSQTGSVTGAYISPEQAFYEEKLYFEQRMYMNE